jgi:hypothetical protein
MAIEGVQHRAAGSGVRVGSGARAPVRAAPASSGQTVQFWRSAVSKHPRRCQLKHPRAPQSLAPAHPLCERRQCAHHARASQPRGLPASAPRPCRFEQASSLHTASRPPKRGDFRHGHPCAAWMSVGDRSPRVIACSASGWLSHAFPGSARMVWMGRLSTSRRRLGLDLRATGTDRSAAGVLPDGWLWIGRRPRLTRWSYPPASTSHPRGSLDGTPHKIPRVSPVNIGAPASASSR